MKLTEQMPGLYTAGRPTGLKDLPKLKWRVTFAMSAPNAEIAAALGGWENDWKYRLRLIPDAKLTPDKIRTIELVVREVVVLLQSGRQVVVHCRAGRNRSCLIAALVMRDMLGLSGPEALERVRRNRPRAIANPAFEEYLLQEGWKVHDNCTSRV